MKKKIMIPLTLILTAFLAWIGFGYFSVRNLEKPNYKILSKEGAFELREYEPFIIAQASVPLNQGYDKALNQGFRVVADYIFGNNLTQDKIAMTTPVVSEEKKREPLSEKIAMTAPVVSETENSELKVYFVMPKKYTLFTLPQPKNPQLKLSEIPSQKRLVLSFSGWATEKRLERKMEELKAYAKEKKLTLNKLEVAQYNPPLTPPFMRHNEVWGSL